MNSNPILNREIVTPWHGEAQAAERNEIGKSWKTKLIHKSNNRFFWHYWIQSISSITTTKIQQEYIICGIISPKIRMRCRPKKLHIIYFLLKFAFNFLARICRHNSGSANENPQNSVWLDWLSAQPEIATASSMARVSTLDPWKWVLMHYTLC